MDSKTIEIFQVVVVKKDLGSDLIYPPQQGLIQPLFWLKYQLTDISLASYYFKDHLLKSSLTEICREVQNHFFQCLETPFSDHFLPLVRLYFRCSTKRDKCNRYLKKDLYRKQKSLRQICFYYLHLQRRS